MRRRHRTHGLTRAPPVDSPAQRLNSRLTSPTNQERNHVMLRKKPLFVLAVGAVLVGLLTLTPTTGTPCSSTARSMVRPYAAESAFCPQASLTRRARACASSSHALASLCPTVAPRAILRSTNGDRATKPNDAPRRSLVLNTDSHGLQHPPGRGGPGGRDWECAFIPRINAQVTILVQGESRISESPNGIALRSRCGISQKSARFPVRFNSDCLGLDPTMGISP